MQRSQRKESSRKKSVKENGECAKEKKRTESQAIFLNAIKNCRTIRSFSRVQLPVARLLYIYY